MRKDILPPFHLLAHGGAVITEGGSICSRKHVACNLRPVIRGADGNVLDTCHIDADPDRKRIAVVHLLRLPEQNLQCILQALLLRIRGKPVAAYMAAMSLAENTLQKLSKGTQKLVSLGKPIAFIVVFHPVEVEIQKRSDTPAIKNGIFPFLRHLQEAGHAGKTRQVIITACPENAFLVQRLVERSVQGRSLVGVLPCILSLIKKGNISQPRAVLPVNMFSDPVDNMMLVSRIFLSPENHLQPAAAVNKSADRLLQPLHIIRMGIV